ncbi:MAG: hypothetical protein WCF57_19750 [Pyrinomonadaceae bacterium]
MNTTCKVCGFDVSAYPATIVMDSNAHIFHCPVCGQSFDPVMDLEGKDVFYDSEARGFVKWATPAEAAQSEVIVEKILGQFKLQVRAKPLNYQQLFYSPALVFVLDDAPVQNQLFAPPENCKRYDIDIKERLIDPNGTYLELQFRLKGGSRPFRVSLSAAVTRATTDPQTGRINNGSALTVWPNFKRSGWTEAMQDASDEVQQGRNDSDGGSATVEHSPWRDYFVQFDTDDKAVTLKTLRLVGEGMGQEAMIDGAVPKGALDFPPEYIEVTADVAQGGQAPRQYRTCFSVSLNSYNPQKVALSKVLRLAIDFGTSNTCVCYRVPGDVERGDASDNARAPKLLRLRNKNYEVVRGLQLGANVSHTWLPDLEGQDFIPSELVFRDTPQNILGQTSPQPILDYTIPAARWRAGEEKMICTGFKWKHATEPSAVREQYRELQRMYLDLLFRMVVAELVASDGPLAGTEVHPNKIELVYTYPLAMPKERWKALGRLLESIGQSIHQRTGVSMTVNVGVDESRAGEADIKMQGEGQRIFMDIGGGTTDIAVIEQRDNVAQRELLLVDSMRYAGNDFLAALADDAKGGHISTRPLIELQRRVRFFKRAALEDLSVFGSSEERKEDAQDALERFLQGVMQYLARIMILRLNSLGEIADARNEKLKLFLLGNGWNFVLFLPRNPLANPNATPKEVMQEEVSKRLVEELEKFREGKFIEFDPSIKWTELFELHFPQEPKTAVARGALEVTRRPIEGIEKTFIGSDIEVVTSNGLKSFRWDTQLPHDLGVLIDRVSITNPIAGFEALRVPDYEYDHSPDTDLRDIDIKRYVSDDRGRLVASAFNVYLERWYKNFLASE